MTKTYVYDLDNRLVEIKDSASSAIASYYYDPFGRRLWKNVAGTRTYFMYTSEGLVAEMDAAGTVTQSYGYQSQSTYGTTPLYTRTASGYAYYQLDHLGTPQQLVDKTGKVQWRGRAQAFGVTVPDIELVKNHFRFAGQYYDQETGLHYNYFRYYDPRIGRYVTSDPIGLDGGINSYNYTKNNPIIYYDPIGLYYACETVAAVPVDFNLKSKTDWGNLGKWELDFVNLQGGEKPVFWWVARCICKKKRSGIKKSSFEVKWRYIEVCVGSCGLSSNEYDSWETEWENTKKIVDSEPKILWGGFHFNEITANYACEEKCNGLNTGL